MIVGSAVNTIFSWVKAQKKIKRNSILCLVVLIGMSSYSEVECEKLIAQINLSAVVLETLTFSPDSKRLAYVVGFAAESDAIIYRVEGGKVTKQDPERFAVVVDGKEREAYDGIVKDTLIFSPDSQQVAYGAKLGDERFVVVDGEEGKKYDGIGEGTLIFSPDSRHLAYGAIVGKKSLVVVDREDGKKYDFIIGRGSKTIIFDSPDSFHYLTQKMDNISSLGRYMTGSWDIYLVEEQIKGTVRIVR